MIPLLIGILLGLTIIVLLDFFKLFETTIVYGLLLSSIGFLYVGFTWSNRQALLISVIQALFFIAIAYYGIKKNSYLLAVGYFTHGLWDIAYTFFQSSNLLPPHYDLFCLSFDFTIAIYLVFHKFKLVHK